MYYPSSENKGADQLRGYREADLRLCFRLCRLLDFPCGGSYLSVGFSSVSIWYMSHVMRKPDFCPGENKDADQIGSNCEADQCLYFRYTSSSS